MSDYNVGQVIGYLKLNRSNWSDEIKAAIGESQELARQNPNVKITTNGPEAIAQLSAVAAATKRLQDAQGQEAVAESKLQSLRDKGIESGPRYVAAQENLAKAHRATAAAVFNVAGAYETADAAETKAADSAATTATKNKESTASFGLLFAALAVIGPALIPIAAGAVGAAGALGGMSVAGLLAFKGISNEISQGTALGQTYIAQMGVLKGSLQTLEQTAASGFLTPVSKAVALIQAQMPQLNAEVSQFAAMAGHIGVNIFSAVLNSIHAGMPLFIQFGVYVDQLTAKFERWTGGSGFQSFIAYIQNALPGVEHTLGELGTLVEHIVVALAPMGGVALSSIGVLAQVLNSLPIGVLQILVPLLIAAKLGFDGFKAAEGAAASLSKWSTAAQEGAGFTANFASAANIGSKAIGALGVAGLIAGPIIGGLAGFFGQQSEAQKQATQTINDYTAALIASNGVVNESIYNSIAKKLLDQDALSQAQSLHIAERELTGAVAGNGAAYANVTSQLKEMIAAGTTQTATTTGGKNASVALTTSYTAQAESARKLLATMEAQRGEFQKSQTAQSLVAASADQLAESWALLTDQSAVTKSSIDSIADTLGLTTQQGNAYAATIGITGDMLTKGEVTNAQYADAVYKVQRAYTGATAEGDAYLKALSTFAATAGTTADRATLIGATLVASQGDMLSYTGAMAGGTGAAHNLTLAFEQNVKDTQSLVKAYRDTEQAAITYTYSQGQATSATIDYTKTGAVPLVQQLEAIQSAAKLAAQATYQHEAATGDLTKASDDAIKVFDDMTNGALVKNASQLGLTTSQAKALADGYFNISDKDLKSTVEAIGLSDIKDVLQKIGDQLAFLTGHPFEVKIGFALNNDVGALVNHAVNDIPLVNPAPHAAGGMISQGWNILGEQGPELFNQSTGMVYTAAQTAGMLGGAPIAPPARMPSSQPSGGAASSPQIIVNPSAGLDERAVGTIAGRYLVAAMA